MCTIDDCTKTVLARDLCAMHYRRLRRHGDTSVVLEPRRPSGADHPRWRGGTQAYRNAHRRVERARGKASTHACVDCGGPATDWAFDEPTGFSNDVTRYRPLCRPCHRASEHLFKRAA